MERPFYSGDIPHTPDSNNAEIIDNHSNSESSSKSTSENKRGSNEPEPSLFKE